MPITYKSLYEYVVNEIERRTSFSTVEQYNNQLERTSIAPLSDAGRLDANINELVEAIMTMLQEAIPPYILEGLTVTASTPPSNVVTVASGKGSVGGKLYTLDSATTVNIPFDDTTSVFYISLYKNNILVGKDYYDNRLTVAKIIVPNPGTTDKVIDTKDGSWDAYIVNFKEYRLYGYNDKFEEDTIELLRENISPILADNLIGNIKLSENLKIINTQGTLELNSDSLKLRDPDNNVLAKFDRKGIFLYNSLGVELAKFTGNEARIGNIRVLTNSIQSGNFISGVSGFRIRDNGDVEFCNGIFRGNLSAPIGTLGGWTITSDSIYATTTGTIKTSNTVGSGSNGVILDKDGLRVYDDVLGLVVDLPSDGSAPTFSSGTINEVTFEISTNTVLRTSSTVGDGTASSAGILINNTGLYGCEPNQLLSDANLKALIDGSIKLKGEIQAESGLIGGTIIEENQLTGGLIVGSLIRSPVIETSSSVPRIRIDSNGMYYQATTNIGKYGSSDSGSYGFKYGDGTLYGMGTLAYLFNTNFPPLSIVTSQNMADIRLYNRSSNPTSGTHIIGDLICVNADLKLCTVSGSPGTFSSTLNPSRVRDNDNDTKIQVEEISDEDIIRFDTIGEEQITIQNGKIEPTTNNDIDLGSTTKEFKDIYIDGIAYIDSGYIDLLGQNLDCNQKQLLQLIIENRISDPTTPTTGQIWFRTDI